MYAWRKMTEEQREEALRARRQFRVPWHAPPHFGTDEGFYHISAACYEHGCLLDNPDRIASFESELVGGLGEAGIAEVRAWVVLPNHYHLLLKTRLPVLARWLHRLHNRTSTRWNGEDAARGRKVWHRFSDRAIRGDVHYFRTINYIHANHVKHGFVAKTQEWPWSSYAEYEHRYGHDTLVEWWRAYPITGYGKGWDD